MERLTLPQKPAVNSGRQMERTFYLRPIFIPSATAHRRQRSRVTRKNSNKRRNRKSKPRSSRICSIVIGTPTRRENGRTFSSSEFLRRSQLELIALAGNMKLSVLQQLHTTSLPATTIRLSSPL